MMTAGGAVEEQTQETKPEPKAAKPAKAKREKKPKKEKAAKAEVKYGATVVCTFGAADVVREMAKRREISVGEAATKLIMTGGFRLQALHKYAKAHPRAKTGKAKKKA